MAKKSYIEIGHDNPRATLWVFTPDKKLVTRRVTKKWNTHEDIWGIECANWFRGRHDPDTCELSLVFPVGWPKYYGLPVGLEDALIDEFGDCRTYEFNPGKRKR